MRKLKINNSTELVRYGNEGEATLWLIFISENGDSDSIYDSGCLTLKGFLQKVKKSKMLSDGDLAFIKANF